MTLVTIQLHKYRCPLQLVIRQQTANMIQIMKELSVRPFSRLPAVERVIPGYHMTATGTDQKADPVIKTLGRGLGGRALALAGDRSGVS